MAKQNSAVALTSQMTGQPPPASEATKIEQSRVIAEVHAMVVVAQKSPRDTLKARKEILESCQTAGLADRAFFKFPRGGTTVSGASIHMAVELARCWGNIGYGIKELSRNDDSLQSEMMAFAWDLETNTRPETSFIVPHKRDKRGGWEVLIDLRDVYENNANMGARRLREMIFRVLPPWLIEEAKAACMKTLEDGGGKPLPQRIAQCLDAFAAVGITRQRIEAKIGMAADKMQAIDLANLRVSFESLRRGEVSADEEFPTTTKTELSEALGDPAAGGKATEDAQQTASAAPSAAAPAPQKSSAWMISPEAFKSIQQFSEEMIRNLRDVCVTAKDIDDLLRDNLQRYSELPAIGRKAIDQVAEKRRKDLSG